MSDTKYTVYKVTNRFDNKIYIGVHAQRSDNDRYMGSGTEIREALKKEGRKSFIKEILFVFDTKEEMLVKERELVTKEFCMREDTYNRIEGGGTYCTIGMVTVQNSKGGYMNIYNDDPRWLASELVGITKGLFTVIDKAGNMFKISKNDPRYLSGELVGVTKGMIPIKDKDGNKYSVSKNDQRYLSGELVHSLKGKKQHLNSSWIGKTHKSESKFKIGAANSITQKGKSNSQYGTCWITKDGLNKKIKKEESDLYLNQGWIKGRT